MKEYHLGLAESRFADRIWELEPITAAELAKLGAEEFQWKKTTCYTVLKRLCEKGIFCNEGGTVTSRMSRTEFYGKMSEQFVENSFQGSLPTFLAAFASRKKLSGEDLAGLRRMIDEYGED